MKAWKEFEIKCTEFLKKHFGKYAKFTHQGEEDSTVPDILCETNDGRTFYIDAKHSPAQSGQFVLLPDDISKKFKYSEKNASEMSRPAERIIEYMNSFYDRYRDAGTRGEDILLEDRENIFGDWIIDYYTKKDVKYFITNDYKIIPIERIKEYFDIEAKYRNKKSGSSPVGKTLASAIKGYVQSRNPEIVDVRLEGNKVYVSADADIDKVKFVFENLEYMFSKREDEYEIRKLSKTNNANVIFTIKESSDKKGISDSDFINDLKNHKN